MTDQKKIQHVDTDLPMKCAYSFPGVAMTLGRENWGCLKILYINLASELQASSGICTSEYSCCCCCCYSLRRANRIWLLIGNIYNRNIIVFIFVCL